MQTKSIVSLSGVCLFVFLGFFLAVTQTQAATYSICASGCDFTTFNNAFSSSTLTTNDTLTVGATYASTTESWPLSMPDKQLTIDCQNSGAIIGTNSPAAVVDFNIHSSSTVQNCTFSHVWFYGWNKNNFTITNNQFQDICKFHFQYNNGITITNNSDVNQGLFVYQNNAYINNNSFRTRSYGDIWSFAVQTSTQTMVSNNIIEHYATDTANYLTIINLDQSGSNVTFATNTIATPDLIHSGGVTYLQVRSSTDINGNIIKISGQTNVGTYPMGMNISGLYDTSGGNITHNTIFIDGSSNTRANGMTLTDWVNPLYVTSTYNLIHRQGASGTADVLGFSSYNPGPASNLHIFTEYNGFSNIQTIDVTDFPRGGNAIINNDAGFKLFDADTSNDFELAPFSDFLDVNGSLDMGAKSGSRDSRFYLNQNGIIDYINIHGTTSEPLIGNLRSSDSVIFAKGTYGAVNLTTTSRRLTNLNITGSGSNAIIDGQGTGSALSINGLNNSTIQNFAIQNAYAPAVTYTYKTTNILYRDGATTYDQSAGVGAPANSSFFLQNTSCSVIIVSNDDADISVIPNIGSHNFHAVLSDYVGSKITLFVPDNIASSAGDVATQCAGLTVDKFISNVFTANSNILTYDPSAVSAAGVTLKAGLTDPPAIDRYTNQPTQAGIQINNSNNLQLSNLTLTNNSNAISFDGTSTNNKISESTISNTAYRDLIGMASGDNTIFNSSFDRSTSYISGSGNINVYFTPRVKVTDLDGNPLANITVSMQSNNSSINEDFITNSDGFSDYKSTGILAYSLSNSSIAETAGNYNPYHFQITNDGYPDQTTSGNLNSVNQTFSIATAVLGGPGWGKLPPVMTTYQSYTYNSDGSGQYISESGGEAATLSIHDLFKLPDDGNIETQEDSAVYYLGADQKRHAFPNEKVYFSWYNNYDNIKIVDSKVIASITLGKNITYKPGPRLVKFITDPTVYIVTPNANLRGINSEAQAIELFGDDWAKTVHDISDAFFKDYTISSPLDADLDSLDQFQESLQYPSDNMNL